MSEKWELFLEEKIKDVTIGDDYFGNSSNLQILNEAGYLDQLSYLTKDIKSAARKVTNVVRLLSDKIKESTESAASMMVKNYLKKIELKLANMDPSKLEFTDEIRNLESLRIDARGKKFKSVDILLTEAIDKQNGRKADYFINLHTRSLADNKRSGVMISEKVLKDMVKKLEHNNEVRNKIIDHFSSAKEKVRDIRKYEKKRNKTTENDIINKKEDRETINKRIETNKLKYQQQKEAQNQEVKLGKSQLSSQQ